MASEDSFVILILRMAKIVFLCFESYASEHGVFDLDDFLSAVVTAPK